MVYLSPADVHVHMRDTEYPDNDFAGISMIDAEAVGLAAMCEMPNTVPSLTNMPALLDRRRYLNAKASAMGLENSTERYIHIGLTNDLAQVRRALEFVQTRVHNYDLHGAEIQDGLPVADKTFYTHSTQNMGLLDEDYQKKIWALKSAMGYTGVSIGHFEDEKEFIGDFDYLHPLSQSVRQNERAEVIQVHNQLGNAYDAGFVGTFYIAHVSSPETVRMVQEFKKFKPNFKIVLEATFHHLFLNWTDYDIHGNFVKMNPPLRNPMAQFRLLECLLKGEIDIIGTDHAPHPYERKISSTPPSGIPAIPFWPKAIELLREYEMPEEQIREVTFFAAKRIFKLETEPRMVEREYKPKLWDKYGWNPFSRIDKYMVQPVKGEACDASKDLMHAEMARKFEESVHSD